MKVMKPLMVALGFALGVGLGTPGSANEKDSRDGSLHPDLLIAQNNKGGDSPSNAKDSRVQKKRDDRGDAPRYKPPRRGRPWRTIGGATRGSAHCRPLIAVLAPHDHSGLTTREQPTLYWYLSDTCPSSVEFTLIEADGVAPLVEVTLPSPQSAGLQTLDLAPFGVRLEVGKLYMWSIAFVPDRDRRSKDIVAQGGMLRVEPDIEVSERLAAASEEEAPGVFAEAGLWYDALSALSSQIQAQPSRRDLRAQRASLLEQVQLIDVARHEGAQAGANPG